MKKTSAMACLLAVLCLTGCGNVGGTDQDGDYSQPVEAESVELDFWSWIPTDEQTEAIISQFEQDNPDIHINYVRYEQDELFTQLQIALASGEGPDVFGMSSGVKMDYFSQYAAPMDELADTYWPDWRNVMVAAALEECVAADGTMAGMPLLITGMSTFLYNMTLLEECGITEVPSTYEELLEAAEKAAQHGYVCVAVGAGDEWLNADWFVQVSNEFSLGAVYAAEKGELSWTEDCFVDTLTAWQSLFQKGVFEEGALSVISYPEARDAYFFARKSLFFLTGSWHLGATSPSSGELVGTAIGEAGDVIGMAPFPSMSSEGNIYLTSSVDILLCINQDCTKQEAAMTFVEYMANGGGQQYLVNQLQGAAASEKISFTGTVDGALQQASMDLIDSYVSQAVGNRKLENENLEAAIQEAMQNVAAGADPLTELENVQEISQSLQAENGNSE